MHYSFMGKMRLPIVDSDLLYRGALYSRFDYTSVSNFKMFFLYINGNKNEVVPKINVPVKSVNNDIICTNNKYTPKLEPKSVMKALFVY